MACLDYNPFEYDYIVSVDIGVKNLGLSLVSVEKDVYIYNDIIWFELIDITQFNHHNEWPVDTCPLYHDKTYCDYLTHIFYEFNNLFEIAKHILIERQPPMGYVVVEQLIFKEYRNKCVLISPNSVHKYFKWTCLKLDYEQRKEHSIKIVYKHISKQREYLIDHFNSFDRQHDIADSVCIALYFISIHRKLYIKQQEAKILEKQILYLKQNNKFYKHLCLDKYKYKGSE